MERCIRFYPNGNLHWNSELQLLKMQGDKNELELKEEMFLKQPQITH